MRVLLWPEVFWPYMGGGSQFSAELALALRERGHELLVVTRQDEAHVPSVESFHGISVHRFPFHQALSRRDVGLMARLRQEVIDLRRQFAADVVHTTSFGASMLFQLDTARARSAPLLVTLLGEENRDASSDDTALHRALGDAAWVTAPSQATLDYARMLVPGCRFRSSVARVGTRLPYVEPQPISITKPVLVCLGRLDRAKGFDLVLSALPVILAKRPEVRLVVAGDGPQRAALEQETARLGLGRAVDFLGWLSPNDVPELISTASIVVIPSREEAFPLVGLHAGFMARPVVAARVGGIPELVLQGKTGWLVEPESDIAVAESILRLLERPEELRKMGLAARRHCLEHFHFDRIVDIYDGLYRRIVADWQAEHRGANGID
jgi:glycogen(starch) synthase